VSTLTKEEKMKERIEERKLIVHKVAFDLEAVKTLLRKIKLSSLQNWASLSLSMRRSRVSQFSYSTSLS